MPDLGIDFRRVSFGEAIDQLAQKTNLDTETWRDAMGIRQNAVFTVAGAKGQLLSDLRTAVEAAVQGGETLEGFRQRFDQIVQGWEYKGGRDWRSRLIWETNLRTTHAAGRFEQMTQTLATRPYWVWRHGGSRDPRPAHLALDGKVIRGDTPNGRDFWIGGGMYPPIGFGCSCQAFSLSEDDLADYPEYEVIEPPAIGAKIPYVDGSGVQREAIVKTDEGWGYVPGMSSPETREQMLERLRPEIRVQVERDVERSSLPAILKLEDQIRNQRYESAALFAPDGRQLFFKDGEQSYVAFTQEEVGQMVGNIITHNHPGGWTHPENDPQHAGNSFSFDDWNLAAVGEVAEMRAVSIGHRYSIKPPLEGWNSQWATEKLLPAYAKISAEVRAEFSEQIDRAYSESNEAGRQQVSIANARHWHEVALRLASQLGVIYTKEDYKPW